MGKLLLWFLRPSYLEQREQGLILGLMVSTPLVLLASWSLAGNGYLALVITFVGVVMVPATLSNAASKAVGFFGPLRAQRASGMVLFLTYLVLVLGALAVLEASGAVTAVSR